MGEFFARLLRVERRVERYRRIITALTVQVRELQQQLAQAQAQP